MLNDPHPQTPHVPGDAHGGGGPTHRGYRAVLQRVGRFILAARGGHFAPNPYLRNGWDQRIDFDPHELAIAGDDVPECCKGYRARPVVNGVPTCVWCGLEFPDGGLDRHSNAGADEGAAPHPYAETSLPGQPGGTDALLEGGTDPNTGTAQAAARDPHPLVLLNGGRGRVHRLAPTGGYVNAETHQHD